MEWKTKCPRWPLITEKTFQVWWFYCVEIILRRWSLDTLSWKYCDNRGVVWRYSTKREKYQVQTQANYKRSESLRIIYRPCLIRDENIIFQSFYPAGILVKALYEEASARDPTPYSFRNMHFATEKVPFWLTYPWKMMLSKLLKQGRIWCVF